MSEPLDVFGEAFWEWRDRAKTDPIAAQTMLESFGTAWETSDEDVRDSVLIYLTSQPPELGIELVRAAARDSQQHFSGTATVCYMQYIRSGYVLSEEDVEILTTLALDWSAQSSTRGLAIHALEDGKFPDLDQILRRVASEDPSTYNRFQANLDLLRRGDPGVKAALFTELRRFDRGAWEDPRDAASSLWHYRERLDFTQEEASELRVLLLENMDKLRKRARSYEFYEEHPYSNHAATSLLRWLKEGFPSVASDVDLLAAAAFLNHDVDDRIEAVQGIAWFANDRARYRLSELATWSDAPDVRHAAKHELKKLSELRTAEGDDSRAAGPSPDGPWAV